MKNKSNSNQKSKLQSKTPLVSVVMPAYNAENYIAEAIESILNQTYKKFEFIIVNDGSTDNTLQIIKEYAKKDKRIKVIENEQNLGIANSRNVYLNLVKGKYIATQDADDISISTRLSEQVNYLENNKEVGVVGAFIEIFDDATGKTIRVRKYPESDNELRKMVFYCSPIAQPVSMIRKEAINQIGKYNPEYPPAEDLDLWFRIGSKYQLANIQKILLKYRDSKNSATGSKTRLMEKLTLTIRKKNYNNQSYRFTIKARIFNLFHEISLYIIPSKFKLWLFNKIRDN